MCALRTHISKILYILGHTLVKFYIYIYIYTRIDSVRGKKDKEAFRILGRVHCQKGFDVYVSLNHRSKNLETNSFVRELCV